MATTSFLVCQFYYGPSDDTRYRWSRLEIGDADRLDQRFTVKTAFIPLSHDHQCFEHVPPNQEWFFGIGYANSADAATDWQLLPYLESASQLRILPAGGSVKNGAVVVHYFGARDERVARIHRFEAPGATVPFAGREFPIFHVLSPDLVGKIARHYVTTCTVPDGSIVGSGLTWVRWHDGTIGWGGF